jgi:predicted RNA binding protein YcfA (HicA-like mRNA interferase family)
VESAQCSLVRGLAQLLSRDQTSLYARIDDLIRYEIRNEEKSVAVRGLHSFLPSCYRAVGWNSAKLVRLLEREGFRLIKEKGSIRYYAKAGHPHLIRVDFHGAKELPTGTCHAILKAAGLKQK